MISFSLLRSRRAGGALLSALALTGAFVLTGCGGGSGGPSGGNTTSGTTTSGTTTSGTTTSGTTTSGGTTSGTTTSGDTPGGGGGTIGTNTFVFVSTRDGNPEIYRGNVSGENQVRLTSNAAADSNPFIARNRQFMVFSSLRDGNAEIYRFNFANSSLQRFTADEVGTDVSDDFPVISPTSTRIAWVSTRGGAENVWIMDATGANQTQVTTTGGTSPTFAPDGNQLAYINSALDIVVRTLSTGAERVIDTGLSSPATLSDLSWSPDGANLAYTTNQTGTSTNVIQVISANAASTAGATTFVATGNSKTSLTWGPASSQQQLVFSAVSDTASGKTDLFSAVTIGATGANQITTLGNNTQVSWTN